MTFPELRADRLAHGYALEGERDELVSMLGRFCESELGIRTLGNPDFHVTHHGRFGIGEGRELQERAFEKSFSDTPKIFIISCNMCTREAQNALLKLFEEPPPRTHFFLVMPSLARLLPTLRSRLVVLGGKSAHGVNDVSFARGFLSASKARRLEMIKDVTGRKDAAEAKRVLDRLEEVLYTQMRAGGAHSTAAREALAALPKLRGYLFDRSPSLKLILEHAALHF